MAPSTTVYTSSGKCGFTPSVSSSGCTGCSGSDGFDGFPNPTFVGVSGLTAYSLVSTAMISLL